MYPPLATTKHPLSSIHVFAMPTIGQAISQIWQGPACNNCPKWRCVALVANSRISGWGTRIMRIILIHGPWVNFVVIATYCNIVFSTFNSKENASAVRTQERRRTQKPKAPLFHHVWYIFSKGLIKFHVYQYPPWCRKTQWNGKLKFESCFF